MPSDSISVTNTPEQPREIKVPNVICREKFQEYGDLVIPAPCGVTMNTLTGELEQRLKIEPVTTLQIRTVTILKDKVIIMGVVPVRILVNGQVVHQLLEIPFQAVRDCPEARPGDLVQFHDCQIEGFSVSGLRQLNDDSVTLRLYLVLKVVVQCCLIVASESILRVDASEPFC